MQMEYAYYAKTNIRPVESALVPNAKYVRQIISIIYLPFKLNA